MLVNGTLRNFVHDPHVDGLRFSGFSLVIDLLPGGSYVNHFAFTGMADVFTAVPQLVQPDFLGFLPAIALYNEPGAILNQDAIVLRCIVPGIQPDQ